MQEMMGLNKLAQMFMGNPQPLAQKIQHDQQGQPPGGLPKDLEEALALQKIQDMRQAAQNQQAMQAGGKQPTVMEKLRQLTGTAAPSQGQPQGGMPPQMAQAPQAQQPPQGINHLPAQFGLAGGGIVAFNGEDDSDVQPPKRHYTLQEQGAAWEARRQAARDAEAQNALAAQGSVADKYKRESMEMGEGARMQYSPDVQAYARAAQAKEDEARNSYANRERAQQLQGNPMMQQYKASPPSVAQGFDGEPAPAQVERGRPTMPNEVALRNAGIPSALSGQRTAPAAAPVARPPVASAPRPAAAPAQPGSQPAPQGLNALLEQGIRGDLGRDRDAEAQKMVDKQREISGMSDYQKQMADMVARREAAQKAAQENRTPDWVRGLQALGGAPVRGGLGMVLAQAGRGATAARDAYAEEDSKYAVELDALRKAAMDAQLKGNMELAKSYADAYKEVDAARRAAMQSGTSLENTREIAAQRREQARQHNETMAANRATAADQRNMTNAINAIRSDEVINRLQKRAEALDKSPLQKDKDESARIGQQIADRQTAIYKQFGVLQGGGTMSAAPGAASPGGTTRMRFDAQGNPIK